MRWDGKIGVGLQQFLTATDIQAELKETQRSQSHVSGFIHVFSSPYECNLAVISDPSPKTHSGVESESSPSSQAVVLHGSLCGCAVYKLSAQLRYSSVHSHRKHTAFTTACVKTESRNPPQGSVRWPQKSKQTHDLVCKIAFFWAQVVRIRYVQSYHITPPPGQSTIRCFKGAVVQLQFYFISYSSDVNVL
jgi:hypothetical protein